MSRKFNTTKMRPAGYDYSTAIIVFTIIVTPLFVFPLSMSAFSIPKLVLLAWISAVIAMIKFLYPGIRNNTVKTFSTVRADGIVSAGILIAVIYIPFSSNPYLSLMTAGCVTGAGLLFLFMTEVSPAVLITAAARGVFIPVLVGLCQSRGWLNYFDGAGIYGTIGNMNLMSIWLSIAIPFCVGAIILERRFIVKILHAFSCASACYILFHNQIYGAWIAVVGSAFVFIIYPLLVRIGKRIGVGIAIIPLLFVVAVNVAMILLPEINLDTSVMGYSLKTRLSHAADVYRMGGIHPVSGWGPGTFISVYPRYETHHFGFEMMRAHQEYLQLYAETGLIGIACLAFLMYVIWKQLLCGIHCATLANRVAASSFTAAIISSFSSFPLHEPVSALYILCAVAIALNNCRDRVACSEVAASGNVRRGMPQIFPAIVILIAWLGWTAAPLASEIFIKQGHQYVTKKDFENAGNSFMSAVRLNPSNGYANFLTATMKLQQGNLDKALFYAKEAEKTRDFGSLHYLLSYIYFKKGEASLSEYEMVLARDRGFLPLNGSFNQSTLQSE